MDDLENKFDPTSVKLAFLEQKSKKIGSTST